MGLKDYLRRQKNGEQANGEQSDGEQSAGEQGQSDGCSWLVREPGQKRCAHYVEGGACARPDVFMCRLWVEANKSGAARGYRLSSEPDPFATDDDDRAWQPSGDGIDPFEVDESPEAVEPSAGEPDPFELGGDEGLAPERSSRRSMSDPEPEDEQAPTQVDQLTLAKVPDVPPPAPPRRSRIAQAVKGGRSRGRGRTVVRPPPEPPPRPVVTPVVQGSPETPGPFAGTVESEDVARLEALGLEVTVDGWGDKPVRLVAEGARGETDEAFELSFRDAAAIANTLHAFPGARIKGIVKR